MLPTTDFEPYLAARLGIPSNGLLASLVVDLRRDPDMWRAIAALHTNGVRIAVVSNSWGAGYFSPYAGWDLDQHVDAIVISHEVRMRKPDPGIFAVALDAVGVTADRAVFVDDMASNLIPAQAMGIHVVHHTDSADTIARLGRLFGVRLSSTSVDPIKCK
jgi:putative hydrolase of the HAD superfamily